MPDRPGSLLTLQSPAARVGFNWLARLPENPGDSGPIEPRQDSPPRRTLLGASITRGEVRLGYQPDLPDARDAELDPLELRHESMEAIRRTLQRIRRANFELERGGAEASVCSFLLGEEEVPLEGAHCDLRETGCLSAVRDDARQGRCAAAAVVTLVEYLLRAGIGTDEALAVGFVHRLAQRLQAAQGRGSEATATAVPGLRTTLKALRRFGAPPEALWSSSPNELGRREPEPCHFAYANAFRELTYARLDTANQDAAHTLDRIRNTLLDGFPIVFGFPVYSSIDLACADNHWIVPAPSAIGGERLLGGASVLAIGFDDQRPVGNGATGALLVQTSWGATWGDGGCFYLPYAYVLEGLARDFWTIFNPTWIDLERFE